MDAWRGFKTGKWDKEIIYERKGEYGRLERI